MNNTVVKKYISTMVFGLFLFVGLFVCFVLFVVVVLVCALNVKNATMERAIIAVFVH